MISAFVDAINAKLVSIGAWCQTIRIGDEFAEETGAPPRITIVPLAETYAPPTGPGGNPRPLMDRFVACEVIVWGLTLADTEGLVDQFVIALHRAVKDTSTTPHSRGGAYRMGKGRWDRTTNLEKHGFQYRLGVELVIPVLDRDWSTTPMQAPDASTYTADEILTSRRVPNDTAAGISVARGDDAASDDAADEVNITVPTP